MSMKKRLAHEVLDKDVLRTCLIDPREPVRLKSGGYSPWVGLHRIVIFASDTYVGLTWEDRLLNPWERLWYWFMRPSKWATILMLLPLLLVLWN